jgi:four helix bundle protein
MEKARCFEDLWIWQQARILVKNIYHDFNQGKGSQDYGFRNQIQKAGVSIMNNIAEGFERSSDLDFARFLDIAKGSCGEVRSMYYAARDLDYVQPEVAENRRTEAKRISGGISSLTGHLRPNNN